MRGEKEREGRIKENEGRREEEEGKAGMEEGWSPRLRWKAADCFCWLCRGGAEGEFVFRLT